MSDSEIDSESDSEQQELETGLRAAAAIFEQSLAQVDSIIAGLTRLKGKLTAIETHAVPIQKEMYRGKFEIRKTVAELSVKKGDTITFKELVGRIIAWIEAEGMEAGGVIKPTHVFASVFGLKKATVKFPEVLALLKKLVV